MNCPCKKAVNIFESSSTPYRIGKTGKQLARGRCSRRARGGRMMDEDKITYRLVPFLRTVNEPDEPIWFEDEKESSGLLEED